MAVENREYLENLVYETFKRLDPSGTNTEKYKQFFSTMSEKEFEQYMKRFLDSEDLFVLDIVELEHQLEFKYCEDAAKYIGVPLMEYLYMPHLTMDKKNVVRSKMKVLVGYVNVKPTQQLLHKKNGLSTSNDKRSMITGQVTGSSKNGRNSDVEATLLVSLGADKIIQELHGPRADDMVMKREMMQQISSKGYVELDELENSTVNKTALNTVNTYLLSMGLKSDIVSDSYILPKITKKLLSKAED